MINHTFEPVFDTRSQVLILGSFPSVKSREQGFYYGHPRNRFWKLMAGLTGEPVPETVDQKKALLLSHGIAIWDVVMACDITGSSDSSIRNVVAADLSRILEQAPIRAVYANGTKAGSLYHKYLYPRTRREIVVLPSTSPANAAWQFERLVEAWQVLVPYLKDIKETASSNGETDTRGPRIG